jgi:anti-anti-sigma factor
MKPQTGSDTSSAASINKPFAIDCEAPAEGLTGIVVVKVSGFLDAHTVDSFERRMDELLEQSQNRLIMDLGALNYMSSAGIGAMMVLLQQLRRRQGDMVIMQPSAKVYKILDLLGFTRIFNITDNRDNALKMLGA